MIEISGLKKFNVREIALDTYKKDWLILQSEMFDLGDKTLAYMINYIDSHRRRRPIHTSQDTKPLKEVIDIKKITGMAEIGWGVGYIPKLNKEARHWAAINFGSNHIIGMIVPGFFESGAPKADMRGRGKEAFFYGRGGYAMKPSVGIPPMNYVSHSRIYLNRNVDSILRKLRGAGKGTSMFGAKYIEAWGKRVTFGPPR